MRCTLWTPCDTAFSLLCVGSLTASGRLFAMNQDSPLQMFSCRMERPLVPAVLWSLAIVLFLIWPLAHLGATAWDNDEGLYLQRAALANAGHPLYVETLIDKPPLLVWLLQAAFKLAGNTITAARLTILVQTLMGFMSTSLIAWLLWGKWAGVATAWTMLGFSELIVRANVIMPDLPAAAWSSLAVVLALSFRKSGKHRWLFLAGTAYAGALLIHPLLIYTGVPMGVALVLPGSVLHRSRSERSASWIDLAVVLSALAGTLLLCLSTVDSRAFIDWVIKSNYDAISQRLSSNIGSNFRLMIAHLATMEGLVAFAVTSSLLVCATSIGRRRSTVLASWWLGAFVTLLLCSPTWPHYLILLTPPLFITAGGGIGTLHQWMTTNQGDRPRAVWLRASLAIGAITAGTLFVVQSIPNLAHELTWRYGEWSEASLAAQRLIRRETAPGTYIATDDPFLAFNAGRLILPSLAEGSFKQITTGRLRPQDVVREVLEYQTPLVFFATGQIEHLPGFEQWVAAAAAERFDVGDARAYLLNPSLPDVPLSPSPSRVGTDIELIGYQLSSTVLRAGESLTATLIWETKLEVPEDYHVFVHLVNAHGQLVGQHDSPPLMGCLPTSSWPTETRIPDLHPIQLQPDLAPGEYLVVAGMYRWPSVEQLPALRANGSPWPDYSIVLGKLDIVE